MAVLITAGTLVDGWRDSLGALVGAPRHEIYDLVVEVAQPAHADPRRLAAVDDYLRSVALQSLDTVANTIFPARRSTQAASRPAFYHEYERILPRIKRRDARNRHGTYFSRIIRYPLQPDPTRSNQLERIIADLGVNAARRMRHIYEIQVFAPGKDLRPEGFPCLSSLSMHVDAGRLRLAATYRNQFYVERGLGNFLGLARLQEYISTQAGLPTGALSVHAFHAQLDRPLREVQPLIDRLEEMGGK
jgi:thymidylate synthase